MSAAEYYAPSGTPGTASSGSSAAMRAEMTLIQAGFAKLPDLATNANKAVIVNGGANGMTVTVGTLALAAAFALVGAFATTLTVTAPTNVTLPTTGTLATLAGVESLSNKTFVGPALGTPVSGIATNLTGTAAGLTVGAAAVATLAANVTTNANLTGHITSVGNAAVLGSFTLAQLNTAVNDADVASLAGAESLSNKTIAACTLSGTVSGAGNQINNVVIGATTPLAGTFTTLTANTSLVWGTGIATYGLIVKRKTADESVTSSTTFQDDDHLSFAIAANEEWTAEVTLLMGTSLTTTSYKICFTTPAGATFKAWGHTLFTSSEQEISSGGSTSGTLFLGSTPVSGNSAEVKIYLWILNGATPGTVNLQWAQGINIGTALTVKKGSYMVANRVA